MRPANDSDTPVIAARFGEPTVGFDSSDRQRVLDCRP